MDELTESSDDTIFSIDRIPQIPAEANDYAQLELSFEVNLDLKIVNRSYYSLLDCLSDIGGILSVLLAGIAFALAVLNYQHIDNFLVANLFKIGSPGDSE